MNNRHDTHKAVLGAMESNHPNILSSVNYDLFGLMHSFVPRILADYLQTCSSEISNSSGTVFLRFLQQDLQLTSQGEASKGLCAYADKRLNGVKLDTWDIAHHMC